MTEQKEKVMKREPMVPRRSALRTAAAGAGVLVLLLAGCGSGDEDQVSVQGDRAAARGSVPSVESAPAVEPYQPLEVAVKSGEEIPKIDGGPSFTQVEPPKGLPDPRTYEPEDVTAPAPSEATSAEVELGDRLAQLESVRDLAGDGLKVLSVSGIQMTSTDRVTAIDLGSAETMLSVKVYDHATSIAVIPPAGSASPGDGSYRRDAAFEVFEHATAGGRNVYLAMRSGNLASVTYVARDGKANEQTTDALVEILKATLKEVER